MWVQHIVIEHSTYKWYVHGVMVFYPVCHNDTDPCSEKIENHSDPIQKLTGPFTLSDTSKK